MNNHYLLCFLTIISIWILQISAQVEFDLSYNKLTSGELSNCDYSHTESQLEILKTGNEFLKLRLTKMQFQLDKQSELWKSLESKLDKITLHLHSVDNKILTQSKEHLNEVIDMISKQNQWLQSKYQTPAVDDKWEMVADIKEIAKNHDVLLESLAIKLKNAENLLTKMDSWETHTKPLGDSISKNLKLLQNIDAKVTNIDAVAVTKADQTTFNRNIQKYLNKNETPKICLRNQDKELVCTTKMYPTNCVDFNEDYCSDNKCRIYNYLFGPDPFLVACDDHTDGGGWTVIQRRINGTVDFYRGWSEYKNGFGNIDGEFFIGLDKLNALTTSLQPVELLIQLKHFNETSKYAKYDDFHVGNETENYKLNKVGNYSGNAGNSLSQHVGYDFSTKDRDNDKSDSSCAEYVRGAWWYQNCSWSNLNGLYNHNGNVTSVGRGICWSTFSGYQSSLKYVQMSIRPRRMI